MSTRFANGGRAPSIDHSFSNQQHDGSSGDGRFRSSTSVRTVVIDEPSLDPKYLPSKLPLVRPDGTREPHDARLVGPHEYAFFLSDPSIQQQLDAGKLRATVKWQTPQQPIEIHLTAATDGIG